MNVFQFFITCKRTNSANIATHHVNLSKKGRESSNHNYYIISPKVITKAIIIILLFPLAFRLASFILLYPNFLNASGCQADIGDTVGRFQWSTLINFGSNLFVELSQQDCSLLRILVNHYQTHKRTMIWIWVQSLRAFSSFGTPTAIVCEGPEIYIWSASIPSPRRQFPRHNPRKKPKRLPYDFAPFVGVSEFWEGVWCGGYYQQW